MNSLTSDVAIARELANWNQFQDCLLHEIKWVDAGLSVSLIFNFVWERDGSIREDVLEEPNLVSMDLAGVREFVLKNHVPKSWHDAPLPESWGRREIAIAKLQKGDSPTHHRVSVLWEDRIRSIEILFEALSIRRLV